jgi:type I restriction enzyme, S subunit
MNATQLLAHFDRLAEEPDAVPRLRRFILDLAVRGKLVAQDAGNEPAANLLKQISLDKARLVKSREIREEKLTAPVEESEKTFDLPFGWVWARFADYAADIATGPFGSALHQSDYVLDGIPLVNPSHMQNCRIVPDRKVTVSEATAEALAVYRMRVGDIVMARRGEVGRAAVVTETESGWLCGTGSFFLRFLKDLSRDYIILLLRCDSVRRYLAGEAVGTTMVNLNHSILKRMPLAIPPLAEQHRIVAKVDELMALCDQLEAAQQERERRRDRLVTASLQRLNQPAADTTPEAQREHARFHLQNLPRLTTRPEHIKAMRQLLVNLSVVGNLAQPELNDEPADVLLKKIWAEKKSRGLLKPAKESREGNIDLILNSLPAGWAWTTFESFATEIATGPFGSALHQSDYIDGGIPLVNPSHMIDGRIVANPKISVTDETANGLASYRMKSGDVVMARRGEVGRAAIVTDAESGWLCGTGSFFVSFHEEIDRQFVILLLRSDAVRRYLAGAAVGTTMVNLNHGILKRIPLALPPAAEQHRIVAKVDELMALCDQLETLLTITETDSRRLLEAVLEAALAPA